MSEPVVDVTYYSDVLCVWAYVAQIKIDELRRSFGSRVRVEHRFVPVFGSTRARIDSKWSDRGGFPGYARHVSEVVAQFDHVELHADAWSRNVPAGSHSGHLFLKAVSLAVADGAVPPSDSEGSEGRGPVEQLAWRLRLAFFRDLEDIGRLDVLERIAGETGLPAGEIRSRVDSGAAFAALSEDYDDAGTLQISGSPTFVLNEGRQKLYGNVGYRILEANVQELLRDAGDRASWC